MKVWIGVDPGVRNVGLAYINGKSRLTKHAQARSVEQAIRSVHDFIMEVLADKRNTQPKEIVAIAVEDFAFFGARTRGPDMLKVIGGVIGIGACMGLPVILYMPRQKELASSKVSRPEGMTDHEYDAAVLATLAKMGVRPHGSSYERGTK